MGDPIEDSYRAVKAKMVSERGQFGIGLPGAE